MENIAMVVGLIFVCILFLLIVGNVVQFLFKVFFSSLNFSYEKLWFRTHKRVPDRVWEKYEPVLRNFAYYRKLSEESKQKFLFRINRFIKSKDFTGRKELEVTDEKKILISAAAIQLTFGLDNYLMDRFYEIIIYPDIFPSRTGKNYHRGETNLRGVMAFSWKHFYEGFAIEDDKYNLGLHEMAHALEISGLMDGADEYFTQHFYKWSSIARSEYENVHSERASILRTYAGANVHEFFAVCVEHFFEASEEFKTNLPEIYRWLSLTLRQDPLLTIESYAESLQQISNEIPHKDLPTLSDFETSFHLGRLTFQAVMLSFAWIFVLGTLMSDSIDYPGFFLYPVLMYTAVIFSRLSYTYTVFETFGKYLVLRRPLHFNRTHSVAYDNIIRVEFVLDNFDMIRIYYIDRGNMRSLEKYFSITDADLGELKKRLVAKNVLIRN